ncbi:MAG: ferrochelatase [Acidobacteriota bacterium]
MTEKTPGSAGPVDGVLLIGFGGPEAPDEVMPFLRHVVAGRGIPDARLRTVEQQYRQLGGRSPYNDLTARQAAALQAWLGEHGRPLPVHVGMRNWRPWLADALRDAAREGRSHLAGVILAAHRSPVSWERYMQDVHEARVAAGAEHVAVTFLPPWFDAPGFIEACAARLASVVEGEGDIWPADLPVIFTAHSIPVEMATQAPYVSDIDASCRAIADRLSISRWEIAYQSRSGRPGQPWLEPDVADVVMRLAAEKVREIVVFAVGFLCDHVEVLFDLDHEVSAVAARAGVRLRRASCVNDHPAFIAMLGRRIAALGAAAC